jgi:hypothetical protein
MDETRPVITLATVAVLIVGGAVAYYWRGEGEFANFSSIFGLGVSVVGFGITILTMLQTQHIAREAQRKIQEAAERAEQLVDRSHEQARRGMDLIRREISRSVHDSLASLLRRLLDSAEQGNWHRALLCAELSPGLAGRLAEVAWISPEESQQLRGWADDLRDLEGFIRKNRMEGQAGGLSRGHGDLIRRLIGRLEAMEARSLGGAMGGDNAT